MNNKKIYPCKRNNYYYGKLITVRDFEDEQNYFNNKRRLNNVLTTGVGIVSGLSVIQITDKTISIEAGMALDYLGREIIAEESVTKKLNVIEGFDDLDDNKDAFLIIEYAEEKKESVYSVVKGADNPGEESEYNRIKEGYSLRLTNEPLQQRGVMDNLMFASGFLYDKDGIKISVITPRHVTQAHTADIRVKIEKTKFTKNLEIDFYLQMEYFKSADKENIVHVYYKDDEPSEYKTTELVYTVTADKISIDTEICVEKGIVVNGNTKTDIEPASRQITIIKENVYDTLMNMFLLEDFERCLNMTNEIPVYLAKFRILKNDGGYFIRELEAVPFNQFIVSNETLYNHIRNMHRIIPPERIVEKSSDTVTENKPPVSMSAGTEEIEIDMNSKNRTYFSGQIAHGLGTGDVLINVGVQDLTRDETYIDEEKIICGDSSILSDTPYEPLMGTHSTAVILYPEKQTFRIAIRLGSSLGTNTVTVKWWAFKDNCIKQRDYAEVDNVIVTINEKSVTLAPKERFKFTVSITGTDSKECRWSVTDSDGGEIDINGIYQAPDNEGVYQIMAQSVKYPHKRATTFVVVQ